MQIEQAVVDVEETNQVKVPTRAAISLMLAEINKAIDTGVPLTNKRAVRIAAKLAIYEESLTQPLSKEKIRLAIKRPKRFRSQTRRLRSTCIRHKP